MANKHLKETYISGTPAKSKILQNTFVQRLNSYYGFRTVNTPENSFERKTGIKLVRVDVNNPAYRVKNAALGNSFESKQLSSSLEKYFDAWMNETSLSYDDIVDRQRRLNELYFCYTNDPFISRCVHLVADEATQLDVQNRLISIESPNTLFVNRCYELLSQWGVTQARVNAVCFDIQLYGEAFWSHKITTNGIERIIPLSVNQVMERLEFNPLKMAEYLARRDGQFDMNKDRGSKLSALVDLLKGEGAQDIGENITDMFDSKLLGFELQDGIFTPSWAITHFRYNSDHSEFYPYGRPPLIACIAPFKQAYATSILQGLARTMSFPVTLYKVKTVDGINPTLAFDLVNDVREEYDNIGVSPSGAGGEVYTVNTKMWVPEGLVDVDVKESKVDIDFTGDLELYQDRVAVATGIPKGYLVQEWGGWGNSAVSLVEQFKPFARHVYTVQSTFLEGLGTLLRLHFAITGEFDYNVPFTLSMRFPAEEMDATKREARAATIELSNSIIEMITSVLGLDEGEPLPQDVVTDILSKYSFLDPTDIQKWFKMSSALRPVGKNGDDSEHGDDSDFDGGFGGGSSGGGGSLGSSTDSGTDTPDTSTDLDADIDSDIDAELDNAPAEDGLQEAYRAQYKRRRFREIKKLREKRLVEVSRRYKENKSDMYFHLLEQQNMKEFVRYKRHVMYVPLVGPNDPLQETFKVLTSDTSNGPKRMREDVATAQDMIDSHLRQNTVDERIDRVLRGEGYNNESDNR